MKSVSLHVQMSEVEPVNDYPVARVSTILQGSAVSLLWLGGVAATAGSVLGIFGDVAWFLDLFAHFRPQYAVVLLVAAVSMGLLHRRVVAGVFAGVFILNLVSLAPLWIAPSPRPEDGPVVRLITFNVWTSNRQHESVIDWLLEQDADVLVLQELNREWFAALESGLTGYRSLDASAIREDNFGMSVYVRDDMDASAQVVYLDGVGGPAYGAEAGFRFGVPSMDAELNIDGRSVRLLAVHTLPPVSATYDQLRRRQLKAAGQLVSSLVGPNLIAGDLNATRWSAPLRQLLRATDLRDSAEGFGVQGTWPTGLWWTGMIMIDHVLASPEFDVVSRRVGPAMGSDHRRGVVDLKLIQSQLVVGSVAP